MPDDDVLADRYEQADASLRSRVEQLVLEHPGGPVPADGYILVCPSTDPAWVPLFLAALHAGKGVREASRAAGVSSSTPSARSAHVVMPLASMPRQSASMSR